MTELLTTYTTDLNNWQPMTKVAEVFPQFTKQQLKRLFWQREKHMGLMRCYKQVGKRGYVCLPLFGMWLAGQLPEQQED
ncbi:hypothetical protein BCT45_05155 [Vibrio breoganii]|uniref:hypothetical protein n=1 Tax=Vibrio breoganii TaxID=553239 RepID=UPI000C84FA8F|nr:hypothetical protein [Vibrio breoganii]PMM87091.1 hypothetical protein BCT45_05155 [Vibrio breoganii]